MGQGGWRLDKEAPSKESRRKGEELLSRSTPALPPCGSPGLFLGFHPSPPLPLMTDPDDLQLLSKSPSVCDVFSWTADDFSQPPLPCAGSGSFALSCFLTLEPRPLPGTRSPPGARGQPATSLVPPSPWALGPPGISKTEVSQFGCL